MSIPSDTLNTMQNLYDDFQEFKEAKDWDKAEEIIISMEDFGADEAQRMRIELAEAQKAV